VSSQKASDTAVSTGQSLDLMLNGISQFDVTKWISMLSLAASIAIRGREPAVELLGFAIRAFNHLRK